MADNLTTTTGAVFIPELWSRELVVARDNALVMAPLVTRFDSQVKGRGDIVHIPHISNLSVNDKTQGSEVTRQQVTETETTLTIDQWREVSFAIEDILKVQSQTDLRSEYTKQAGIALAKDVDTKLLGLYSSLTSTDVGTYGTDITDATVVAGLQTLDEANVPLEERYLVIAPSQKAAIMKLDKFVKATYLGKMNSATPVMKGPNSRMYWGEIYGIPTYYTNQVTTTAATPTQTHNLLFHKSAFVLAMQSGPRVQTDYLVQELSNLVVADQIYGYTVLRADHGVELRS